MIQTNDATWNFYIRAFPRPSTEDKIQSFQALSPGWDHGEGVAPDSMIAQNTIRLNRLAHALGFTKTDAFPGTDGDILLALFYENYDLEFTFRASGDITYYKMRGNENIEHEEGLTFDQALFRITKFKAELWRSSESSTSRNTVRTERGGQVPHLRIREGTPGFQFSDSNAFFRQIARSAGT